jgi:hypothetical protein
MGKWLKRASDISDDSANSAPCRPIDTNVTIVGTSDYSVSSALRQLVKMVCPETCDPCTWAVMVDDAKRLVEGGWVCKALALGWGEIDLFGIAKDQDGSPGLAAWLGGDEVTAILDSCAVVRRDGGRRYFSRPVTGAVLPWRIKDDA